MKARPPTSARSTTPEPATTRWPSWSISASNNSRSGRSMARISSTVAVRSSGRIAIRTERHASRSASVSAIRIVVTPYTLASPAMRFLRTGGTMARLEVTDDGIWVHLDPTGSLRVEWADLRKISVHAWSAPPTVGRTITLEIGLANGEKVTLDDDSTEGFDAALAALSGHRDSRPVDIHSLPEDAPPIELWRR
jgi:hypothetical protein